MWRNYGAPFRPSAAALLAANFPRTYIDPNRELADIDVDMLAGPWAAEVQPSEKTRLGSGLIWRLAAQQAMYDRKLSVAEVENRIRRFHQPYHAALSEQIEAAYAKFGGIWHLNLHSMPANSYEIAGNRNRQASGRFRAR